MNRKLNSRNQNVSKNIQAVIRVGNGRGFLVASTHYDAVVLTAAHNLPDLPPAHPASLTTERTYTNLLAPLDAEPTISAQCVFVDPIEDVAVLVDPVTLPEYVLVSPIADLALPVADARELNVQSK